MVLPLKRWKSRTSPGIEAGVLKPIHNLKNNKEAPSQGLFAFLQNAHRGGSSPPSSSTPSKKTKKYCYRAEILSPW